MSGRRADGPVEVIDADLSTVTAYADKVLHVGGDPPWLLHLELQGYRDPALPSRVHFYNALLEHRHGAAVWSVVVLLCRPADHPGLTGVFQRGFPGEPPYRSFRYQVVRVWQTPAETFLNGGLGTLPLAPLSDVAATELPGVIGRMEERIEEAAPDDRGALWTATGILMGMRFESDLIEQLLQGVRGMENSTFYQRILEKGRADGALRELRKVILLQGRVRFGPPTPETEAALAAVPDLDRLERLCARLVLVSDWDELLAAP